MTNEYFEREKLRLLVISGVLQQRFDEFHRLFERLIGVFQSLTDRVWINLLRGVLGAFVLAFLRRGYLLLLLQRLEARLLRRFLAFSLDAHVLAEFRGVVR